MLLLQVQCAEQPSNSAIPVNEGMYHFKLIVYQSGSYKYIL